MIKIRKAEHRKDRIQASGNLEIRFSIKVERNDAKQALRALRRSGDEVAVVIIII